MKFKFGGVRCWCCPRGRCFHLSKTTIPRAGGRPKKLSRCPPQPPAIAFIPAANSTTQCKGPKVTLGEADAPSRIPSRFVCLPSWTPFNCTELRAMASVARAATQMCVFSCLALCAVGSSRRQCSQISQEVPPSGSKYPISVASNRRYCFAKLQRPRRPSVLVYGPSYCAKM